MIIKLHRWQPKGLRYRIQTFELGEDSAPVLDIICNLQDAISKFADPSTAQIIARTQQIARVLVSEYPVPCVEIFLQPIIERKYEEKGPRAIAGQKQKIVKRPSDCRCSRFELTGEHDEKCPSRSGKFVGKQRNVTQAEPRTGPVTDSDIPF